ncbi:MAG: endolytic transglycosylase MltG [Clostridia bacterium]|nr:endolytic transglycosylase MltG [Clostridia bacterium]
MISDKKLYSAVALCAAIIALLLIYVGCVNCSSCQSEEQPYTPPAQQQESTIATVRVTFPEGKNILQYGELLEQNGVCTAQEFYDAMNTTDFSADYDFLPSFEKLADRPYKLEVYLFPDTYDFYQPESAQSVIKRFLSNFAARVPAELRQSAANTGEFYGQNFSFDDVLIMASIVEREINIPEEMPRVAAVFYNRMKYPGGTQNGAATGGFFQSDATKFYPYVFGTQPEGFVSEYNTFNVKGLPKGPICCPSYEAIRGALDPDHSTEAFFFYTDINKKVYYAVTFDEHQSNWRYCVDNGLAP